MARLQDYASHIKNKIMFGRKKNTVIGDNSKTKYITKASGATKMKKVEFTPQGKKTTVQKQSGPNSFIKSNKMKVRVNEKGFKPYTQVKEKEVSLGNLPLINSFKKLK
jgi:hypothetical protein